MAFLRPVTERTTSLFATWPQWRKDMGLLRHSGVDFATPVGTVVNAAFDGMAYAGRTGWGGLNVEIHGVFQNGRAQHFFTVEYHHLLELIGDFPRKVQAGEDIAKTGPDPSDDSQQSTGPHLHMIVRLLVDGVYTLTDAHLWMADVPKGEAAFLGADSEGRLPLY